MTIRAFLAVEISEETRRGVADLLERLRKGIAFTGADPSWSRPESMHVTIQFLGQIEETMVDRIDAALRPSCAALPPFEFGVRGVGVFPSQQRPRVVWVGVKKADDEMQHLHAVVETRMAELGFPREERAFHPHLTLARLKSGRGAAAMMKILLEYGRHWCGDSRAEKLVLFQSQLDPKGAIYTRLREFPFEGTRRV
ncbi:MAG: RNA 2',3'-cyclic phosphodiesterase [Candidatus Sumerlaeota bacterium]|nr:RNA 2',3'-cyclic phosphodiesterase [Candidatus Sumerlaeota bacterium]